MKKRDLILYSLIFVAFVAFTAQVVFKQLTGDLLVTIDSSDKSTAEISASTDTSCTNDPVPTLADTEDPQLSVLGSYYKVCESKFFDEMMTFTNMPYSEESAVVLAKSVAKRLKEFSNFNITPLVIIEPDSEAGLVDFHEYAKGDYDKYFETYFQTLKNEGLNDDEIGIWIPFPEPQQSFWENNDNPDDYAASINRHLSQLRKYFPSAKTAILLDSQVGVSDGASQLVAYTRIIDPNLVDIVGVQGFPWHPTEEKDTRKAINSASTFTPAYMIEEVANSLNTKQVLINTGTYRRRKAANGGEIAVSATERMQIADSIIYETKLLNEAGYSVTLNIFAENKLETREGVDWSYSIDSGDQENTQRQIFKNFVSGLLQNNVNISIFDSKSE